MDSKQSKQIANLAKAIARLQSVKNGKSNVVRKPKNKNGSVGAAKAYVNDPVVTSVRSFFRPFDTEKGISGPLSDGRPSQKFMAKAQTQVSLAAGQGFVFIVAPNVASDTNRASVVFATGAFSGGLFTTDGPLKNATAGDKVGPFGALTTLSTSTPYSAATLSIGYEFSCTGSGLKLTYEGAELYRGGTLRYVADLENTFASGIGDWGGSTVNGIINFINSSANTVRQSINKDNVVEVNTSVIKTDYDECMELSGTCFSKTSRICNLVGGASGTTYLGLAPAMYGYYVNTSGNSISFHVDVVEHYSISAPAIQALQTPSYAHAQMATHVSAVMTNVRQMHAGQPNTHHVDMTKQAVKAFKSPLGHEILNAGLTAALA